MWFGEQHIINAERRMINVERRITNAERHIINEERRRFGQKLFSRRSTGDHN